MRFFVDVIIPIPIEQLFTYAINEAEYQFLKGGMRIAVPFGKSKMYTALVVQVHTNAPTVYDAKEIDQIIDEVPIVTEEQLKHWQWISTYYMCTIGEVYKAAMPSALLLESETLIIRNDDAEVEIATLLDDEYLVYEALQRQSILRIHEIAAILDKKTVLPVVNRLLAKQILEIKEEVVEQYKPKLERHVRMAERYTTEKGLSDLMESLARAKKQREAVMAVFQEQALGVSQVKVSSIAARSGVSGAVIKALIDKGIFEEYQIQTDRVQFNEGLSVSVVKELNTEQATAFETIEKCFAENKVTLLHGVTSSGKTEVYVSLIEACLKRGQQALYLLPEIALTTQLIGRLQHYFGSQVAVYHSKYTSNERVEVWQNVLENKFKAQVIIGARSALFLPFKKLGLIIIDEEHESSFKQYDPAPRYHARDAAIVLGHLHKANVLLGSATPSIETYENAMQGKYGFAEIKKRFGNVLMPEIELVDIKEQTRKKRMKGHFSERLLLQIEDTLAEKGQVILFQNRRGFAPIMECNTCGHSPQCPNCDVSLTYHQYKKQLRCHYCSYHMAIQQQCLACGSATIDTKGFGTEQVEAELKELFPLAKIGRMDLDTTRGKHGYQRIISAFESHEIDILVGTQMLTKGLDFRNVSLVGIMNADTLLNFPDFRAHERTFQLLTQVAGRAGRTEKRGLVLVQTYNPYHQILKQVSGYQYKGMYEEQRYEREQFKYPPFNKIIKVTFKHRDYNVLNEAAEWFGKGLHNAFSNNVLGPEFPAVSRIRNQYLKHVIVKIPRNQSLVNTKNCIKRIEKSFNAISKYRSVRVVYNVDHI